MYTLRDYDMMFADPVRTEAYLRAIAAEVRSGDVVVEIGTGVGYFAVAAARAGARHVYAIERNSLADVARQVVADNGCEDRITVIHGDASDVSLPERGTVLLEDIRDVLPFFQSRVAVIVDARARHLVPDARFVSVRDVVWAAPVVAQSAAVDDAPLASAPYGIDRRVVAKRLRDVYHRVQLSSADLLAAPSQCMSMDMATITSANADASATFTIDRDGVLDGFAVWFDAEMAGGARISNAPSAPRALYGQAFFPITRALDVRAGDVVVLEWRALLVTTEYVFAWTTRHEPVGGRAPTRFRQTTLASVLPGRAELARFAKQSSDGAGALVPGDADS